MADGANPRAGLVNVNGTLYGTTFIGGDYSHRLQIFTASARSSRLRRRVRKQCSTDSWAAMAGILMRASLTSRALFTARPRVVVEMARARFSPLRLTALRWYCTSSKAACATDGVRRLA